MYFYYIISYAYTREVIFLTIFGNIVVFSVPVLAVRSRLYLHCFWRILAPQNFAFCILHFPVRSRLYPTIVLCQFIFCVISKQCESNTKPHLKTTFQKLLLCNLYSQYCKVFVLYNTALIPAKAKMHYKPL